MREGKQLFSGESTLSLAPPGWPVIEPGLLMAYIGRLMVIHVNEAGGERMQQRHVAELTRAIDVRRGPMRTAVLYDVPSSRAFNAITRKEAGDLLKSREKILGELTAAYAMATPSAVIRGLLHAVFWLAPPPYPYAVVNTVREALEFIGTRVDWLDVNRMEREYKTLLYQHAPVLWGVEQPDRSGAPSSRRLDG